MAETIKLKDYFGLNLADILIEKISASYTNFEAKKFRNLVADEYQNFELKGRTKLIADSLYKTLPQNYDQAIEILIDIMGEKNPNETGMFKHYYWLMPVSDFIIYYGVDQKPEISINAIYELTQRCTGEYAIRPFITKQPQKLIKTLNNWADDKSFHIRRLVSEGLRPKLPWAQKLDVFIENYQPVFDILEKLKFDEVKFVKKSVANNINDYLKVNKSAANILLKSWQKEENKHIKWICQHATRNIRKAN